MKRRDFLKGCAGILDGGAFFSNCNLDVNLSSRPNIILCMADDQGWGETSYNGHPYLKTPVLDGISLKELIVDGTMDRRQNPIGFRIYNKKPELENEPWLEDTALNEWITLDAKKAKQATGKDGETPCFSSHKHPRMVPENFQTSAAWMTDRYKLIIPKSKDEKTPAPEFYDMQKDRGEENDIASEHPEIVKAMRSELLEWQKSVERSLTGAVY